MTEKKEVHNPAVTLLVFPTKDLEFVAAVKALDTPNVVVANFKPLHYAGAKNANRDMRVEMELCLLDEDGKMQDGCRQIEDLQRQYLNGMLKVDPKKVFAEMRALRSIVTDPTMKHRRNENDRKPRRTEHHVRAEDDSGSITQTNIQRALEKHTG